MKGTFTVEGFGVHLTHQHTACAELLDKLDAIRGHEASVHCLHLVPTLEAVYHCGDNSLFVKFHV